MHRQCNTTAFSALSDGLIFRFRRRRQHDAATLFFAATAAARDDECMLMRAQITAYGALLQYARLMPLQPLIIPPTAASPRTVLPASHFQHILSHRRCYRQRHSTPFPSSASTGRRQMRLRQAALTLPYFH